MESMLGMVDTKEAEASLIDEAALRGRHRVLHELLGRVHAARKFGPHVLGVANIAAVEAAVQVLRRRPRLSSIPIM